MRGAEWTPEWDRAVLAAALAKLDPRYDASQRLLRHAGPAGTLHPVWASLRYALYLLESGGGEPTARAAEILDRALELQVTDPKDELCGLWRPWPEELAAAEAAKAWRKGVHAAAALAEIALRRGRALPAGLRERVDEAVRRAATELAWRDPPVRSAPAEAAAALVALAAGRLFEDEKLAEHGFGRLVRLAAWIDETGSFEDYGSPERMRALLAALTRIRAYGRRESAVALAGRIHDRAWLHLARRWHAPTRQLAGPISYCRRTDIGAPLWLQKALGGAVEFASLEDIRAGRAEPDGEAALLEWHCPKEIRKQFLEFTEPGQRREVFRTALPPAPPVQGTTLLEPEFCLGSVNLGGFGGHERPLLAFWGGPERPARYVRLRALTDGQDVGEALFTSVQEGNCVLGFVNFRRDEAGGELRGRRLRVRFDIAGVSPPVRILAGGKVADLPLADLHPATRLAFDLGGVYLWLRFPRAVFGGESPRLSVEFEDGLLAVSLDLLRITRAETVRWEDVKEAWAALTLVMAAAEGTLEDFNFRCSLGRCEFRPLGDLIRAIWRSPAGRVWMDAGRNAAPAAEQYGRYRAGVRSGPVPYERLNEEPLAAGT